MAAPQKATKTTGAGPVILVIPTLNEAAHIQRVVTGFLEDSAADQIWVLDGGSTDGTRDLVRALSQRHESVSLIHNTGRTQAVALNLAAARAHRQGAQILIRADAHAHYPDGFVSGLVSCLLRTGADSVTVPLVTAPARSGAGWPGAAARLQHSLLGHGGAAHRQISPEGWVSHGHHAAFRLARFQALGGYDTDFCANEDAEFDLRLTRAGGRIWFAPDLAVTYVPRTGPRATFLQMFRNGQGRARTAAKHQTPLALRQLIPVLALLCVVLLVEALLVMPRPLAHIAALPGLGYLGLLLGLSCVLARARPRLAGRIALLAFLSHMGFALGVMRHSLRLTLPRPRAAAPLRFGVKQG